MAVFEKIIDLFMFRSPSDEDSHSTEPVVTTGSILWGVLLRTIVLMVIIMALLESLTMREYWWMMFFVLWFAVAYPAWSQYRKFQERMKDFQEQTLCGSCMHFESNSQLCKVMDEHVSIDYVPCEGLKWEPISSGSD